MPRGKKRPTLKQEAYAMRRLAPKKATTKKAIALAVGYSPSVAKNVLEKIESTEGYANAMTSLARESGNVVLQILNALKHKDMSKEDTKTLVDAASTMANVWKSINIPLQPKDEPTKNSLKVVFQNHAKEQTVIAQHGTETIKTEEQ